MQIGDLVFVNTHGWFKCLSRYWSRRWSHVSIAIGADAVVSADFPYVVQDSMKEYYRRGWEVKVMTPVRPLSDLEKMALKSLAVLYIGKRYDWRGLLSFVFGMKIQNKSAYFCSEGSKEIYEKLGRRLLRKDSAWTTPDDLYSCLEFKEAE